MFQIGSSLVISEEVLSGKSMTKKIPQLIIVYNSKLLSFLIVTFSRVIFVYSFNWWCAYINSIFAAAFFYNNGATVQVVKYVC